MNMIRITRTNGLLILSIAGHGRATHGTVDSEVGSSPFTTSYYKNLGADDFIQKIKLGHYFKRHSFQVDSEAGDTYFWGVRSASPIDTSNDGWQSPLDRLARAQGQLSQAVIRHNAIKEELERSEQALESCQEKLRANQLEIQQYQQQTSDLNESILALEQEVYHLKNSRTWKLTAPLRKLKDG